MKIVVCDDEQIFARDIADCIDSFLRNEKKDFRIDLFYDCTDVFARNEHYDLAFLDVEMYPYNGLELAKKAEKH